MEKSINPDNFDLVIDRPNDLLNNTPPGELEINFNKIQCPICLEEKYEALIVELQGCKHKFCFECLKAYLNIQIADSVGLIHCPDTECTATIIDNDIQKNVAPTLYKEFQTLKLINHSREPGIRWCPNVRCHKMIKLEEYQIFKSIKIDCSCGEAICSNCGEKWHANKSCQEAINENFASFSRHIQVKMCPKCASRTEKTTGCNHMICPRCKYEYCWRCLGEYKNIHICGPERIGKRAFIGLVMWNFCSFLFIMLFSVPLLIVLGIMYSFLLHVCAVVIIPSAIIKTRLHLDSRESYIVEGLVHSLGLILSPFLLLAYIALVMVPRWKQQFLRDVNHETKRQFVMISPQLCSEGIGNRIEEIRIGCLFSCAFYFILFLFIIRSVM